MIEYYKTINHTLQTVTTPEDNTWINIIAPDTEEREQLIKQFEIDPTFLNAALDIEESPHIDTEDNQTAIILDIPDRTIDENDDILFSTIPMAIIIKERTLFTVCIKDTPILRDFTNGLIRNINTAYHAKLIFQIIYRISQSYLVNLKQIDKMTTFAEQQLQRSMKNKELFRLLQIEKSLVYFSTSLKANEAALQKLFRGKTIKLYEEDKELLEDVLIEIQQAIEMCNIYRDILSGTMDAYASVISNNLNVVMKVLTSITILLSIPTIISSIYGMNVGNLPFPNFWVFVGVSGFAVIISAIILKVKNLL